MNLEKDLVKENTKSLVSLSSDDDSASSPILGGGSSSLHSDRTKPIILNNSLSNEESIPIMAPPVLREQPVQSTDDTAPNDEGKPSMYVDSVSVGS